MRVMIVGAAGAMASVAMRDLLESVETISITAADSQPLLTQDARVRSVTLNAQDEDGLAGSLANHDVLLNCLPYRLNLRVMRAALRARVPYIDLGGLYHVTNQQLALHEEFAESGLTAVLGMGSTPGITNVMAGALAARMDEVKEIHVRVACQDESTVGPLSVPYSLETILDEFSLDPKILRDGKLVTLPPMSGAELIHFPAPIGDAEAVYTLHSEVAMLPYSFPRLKEASFKIAFPKSFNQRLRLLVELGFSSREPVVGDVSPREMLLAMFGNQPLSPAEPHDCDMLWVEAKGKIAAKPISATAQSIVLPKRGVSAGALDTGVPLSIVGQMLARGEIRSPGVFCPEIAVPAAPFFKELEHRGIQVSFSWGTLPELQGQDPTSETREPEL